MKQLLIHSILLLVAATACRQQDQPAGNHSETKAPKAAVADTIAFRKGYSDVNGIRMYYEIHGQGEPLVLIHGGGSTIGTTFGRVIPLMAPHRQLICVELQAHGRTGDRNKPLTFAQDADDVAALLNNLNIPKASFFGFSNGGTTAMQIAIRHPGLVDKLILGSALCKRRGVPAQFWEFMKQASLNNMPAELKKAYLEVTPDTAGLRVMHDKDAGRMQQFKDIPDEQLRSVKAPAFIINADKDVITPEHAIQISRLIANSELAIIPGIHGEYIGEVTTLANGSNEVAFVVPMLERFLDRAVTKP